MGRAHVVARTVYAAAKLGLADQLASGPKSAAQLAGLLHVHARSLHRLTRALASLGILTERAEQRFALSALGDALKTGALLRRSSVSGETTLIGESATGAGLSGLYASASAIRGHFASCRGSARVSSF
ncbi:hypothetical protein E4K66_16305 [Bradyrhizobium frederickii]|uniref:O-methyltransferase dimerisation domain-containing protein n=1 Tax=Bradyrhizobium frederickii TaxID=2560054 RepID=A0A4Y9L5P0_9BRAD|nr:hypothetical protein E4K66_16305 [Bradyrhizobium frederickii]